MAPIQLNEPVIAALKGRLENNLQAAIDDINAGVADGFELEPVQQVLGFAPLPEYLTTFPTVGITDGASTFEDDMAFAVTGRHEILVVIYQQNADQEALAWQLRRYTQAICQVILANRNLDDAAWGTGLIEIAPGPALENSDPDAVAKWMTYAGVRIWAKREEV